MLPTEDRVPTTFTVTIDGTQLELGLSGAEITLFPETREEFITALRGIATIPGASAPTSRIGLAAFLTAGEVRFRVFAPAELRTQEITPLSPALESAIADAADMGVAS